MPNRFARYAWATIALTVGVIAGGAVVRATGSGAGCGNNWPRCNGSMVPSGTTESIIEFTHRATSGLAFLAVVALVVMAWRTFDAGHRVRRAAAVSLVFMVGEVLIGAALVLGEWVADDTSVARAVIDGIHLVNTLGLLAALAVTAWWGAGGPPLSLANARGTTRLLLWGMGAVVIVSAAGALTALGDTLFPEATLADDFDNSSHFLVRLRVIHPIIAVTTAVYLVWVARRIAAAAGGIVAALATAVAAVVGMQVLIGVTNLALGAPVWMQVIHLLVTDALWLTLVVLAANLLVESRTEVAA